MAAAGLMAGVLSGRKRPASTQEASHGRAWSLACACAGALRDLFRPRHRRHRWLWLSSPCEGSVPSEVAVGSDDAWHSFCPVCKRPVEAAMAERPAKAARGEKAPERCAYVAALWGAAPGYVLGAMVLAKSLRDAGTKHDLVLLYNDVPAAALELLARAGWKPREVEAVQGVGQLYNHGEPRFQGVFTKLRVFSLLEYAKVLCMDIDTLVIGSMDELFDLPAPAANARGPQDVYVNGDPIDGSTFFAGRTGSKKSWGQCWGINAGVMLLQPSEEDLQQTLSEVTDPNHPSHIKGNGPEQDYLSRYFAGSWTHIGVEYNFQLHQMYHVIHPRDFQDPRLKLMQQFLARPRQSGIQLIHYSGSLKPWSRVLDREYKSDMCPEVDKKFLRATLESFNGYWLWALQDERTVEYQGFKEGVAFGPDKKLYWIDDWGSRNAGDANTLGKAVDIPEERLRAAEGIVAESIVWWREAFKELQEELGFADLAEEVARACPSAGSGASERKPDVKVGWKCQDGWWADWPLHERASAMAGCVPEPFVTFRAGDRLLADARGPGAAGAHLLALTPEGVSEEMKDGDVAGWVDRVPAGSTVFAAFIRQMDEAVTQVLQSLASAGFDGVPTAAAPAGCAVLVLVGRRGESRSWQTMAAGDFALATMQTSGQGHV